jgi:hypothetical protein
MSGTINRISRLGGLVGALALPAVAADAGLDAVVETSAGATAHLAGLWKRPTVLFYEDKDSTALNQHVKDALFVRGRDLGLLDAVSVVAVANVAAFDWFPARNFVLAAVRDVEVKAHVPVYLDFKGSLSAPPWNLPPKTSTVLVLNANGEVVWQVKGRLTAAELERLFSVLDGQLHGR